MSDQNGQAAHALFHALRELHLQAGEPSSRELAKRCGPGNISHNTVNQILRGFRLPRQGHLEVLVAALDGDWPGFKALWCEARREAGPAVGEPPDTDGPAGSGLRCVDAPCPVADELFLTGHDPHTGRWRVNREWLSVALAGAALGDLLLAGAARLVDGRLRPGPSTVDDDTVTGHVLCELSVRDGTDTLNDWVWYLRRDICPLVGQRLATAGVVTPRRARRVPLLRPVVEYRAVDVVAADRPVVRLGGYLLRQVPPPDVRSRLLAALVCAVDMEARLPIDLPVPEIRRRLALAAGPLPVELALVVAAVAEVKNALVELPRR